MSDSLPKYQTEHTPPTERAPEMIRAQFAGSTNFLAYIDVLMEEVQELTQATLDSLQYRYLNEAYGKQLDFIADIVGASRVIAGAAALGLYGFYDDAGSQGVNDALDPASPGGVFWSEGEDISADLIFPDEELYSYIKARIIKNSRPPTINNMIEYNTLLVGDPNIVLHIQEGFQTGVAPVDEPAYLNLHYDGFFTIVQRTVLTTLTKDFKPIGVRMTLSDNSGDIAFPNLLLPNSLDPTERNIL